MERKQRHSKDGDESVDAGALVGREDLPPTNGAIGQNHGDVQRNHRGQDSVQILAGDHDIGEGKSGRIGTKKKTVR